MDNDMESFPSDFREGEKRSFSSDLDQKFTHKKQNQKRSQQIQRPRKDEIEEESFDDDDNSDNLNQEQSKGRGKIKKGVLGIQQKAIQKKLATKHNDNKVKKIMGQHTGPMATFLYKPGVFLPCLSPYLNGYIEIRIAIEYINKRNPALINRLVWGGGGSYSSHSDAVAIAVHHSMINLNDSKLSIQATQVYEGIAINFKVVKGKKSLNGSFKSGILSRSLKQQCPHCLKPEKYTWLTSLGTQEQLVQWAKKMSTVQNKRLTKQSFMSIMSYDTPQPHQRSVGEILMNKIIPPLNEGWVTWNICNEPAQKYNIITFMDRQTQQGYKTNTSYKLRTHDLFIETRIKKYEIYMEQKMRDDDVFLEPNIYSIAEVLEPTKIDLEYMGLVGLPLPIKDKKEIFKNLKWDDFIWGQNYLKIRDKDFQVEGLQCFLLIPLKNYQKNN